MLAALALQVVARYKLGFLEDKSWQFLHVLIGWAVCLGLFVAFHGLAPIRRFSRETWFTLGLGRAFYHGAFGTKPKCTDQCN